MPTRVTVRLPDNLAARLTQAARERGASPSDVLREALERELDAGPPVADDPEEEILERLRRDAARGGVGAARELLKHLRWREERTEPEHDEPDILDEIRARWAERRQDLNGGKAA